MIDVTKIDKVAFAKAVYALSVPQGLGFIHAKHGPLPDCEAQEIAKCPAFFMDYVHGRACKMFIHEEPDGRFTIGDSWYDHTDEQFDQLLKQFGLSRSEQKQHGASCECDDCKPNVDHSRAAVIKQFGHDPEIQKALEKK